MIKAVKQKVIVGKKSTEINSPENPQDTTTYLLSTEANLQELLEALKRVETQDNLVKIDFQTWQKQYSFADENLK